MVEAASGTYRRRALDWAVPKVIAGWDGNGMRQINAVLAVLLKVFSVCFWLNSLDFAVIAAADPHVFGV